MISVPTHGKVFSKKAKNPREPKSTKLLTEPQEPVPQTRRLQILPAKGPRRHPPGKIPQQFPPRTMP